MLRHSSLLGRLGPWNVEQPCPTGFYGNGPAGNMNCFNTTVSGCIHTSDNIALDFGFIPGNATLQKGVIVLLPGDGGTYPSPEQENRFVTDYVNAGYGVVELAWGSQWEASQGNMGDTQYGIRYAACRPATLLNYIYNTYYVPIQKHLSTAGMCAQGFSGGSGALGYALAWYGGGSQPTTGVYLDKVELLSGPVFSDIKQGCIEIPAAPVTVCQGSPSWCQLGTPPGPPYQAPWTQAPLYADHVLGAMRNWTGDNTCESAGPSGYTSATSNQNWLNMSIVNGSSDAIFNYQNTKVTGWLCANVYNNESPMNNSSPQGQIFYQTVAAANSTGLAVYAVQSCNGAEGVMGQFAVAPAVPTECDPSRGNQYCGYWAIKEDMSDPFFNPSGYCHH